MPPIHGLVNEKSAAGGAAGQRRRLRLNPWFGQLMAGPQMIAWLIQLNLWMERFGLSFPR